MNERRTVHPLIDAIVPPQETGGEFYCWKFRVPTAHYAFSLVVTLQRQGDFMMLLNMLVPLENGGLAHYVRFNEYHSTMQSTYIKTIKTKYKNYGIMVESHAKIREYYEGLQRTVFISDFELFYYDVDGNLVENLTPDSSSYTFPPLPGLDMRGETENTVTRLLQVDSRTMPAQDRIYFPWYRDIGENDYEVDEGEQVNVLQYGGSVRTGERWFDSPGIYIDFADQGGDPAMVMNIITLVRPDSSTKRLYGKFCTGYSYHTIQEHVFKKKKKSWFKTKTKISIIRQEFHVEGVRCSSF